MIRRLYGEAAAAALRRQIARQPAPGLLAAVWQAGATPLALAPDVPAGLPDAPGTVQVFEADGTLLAVYEGAGVLLGRLRFAAVKELRAFLPLAGVGVLYAHRPPSGLGWRRCALAVMTCRLSAADAPQKDRLDSVGGQAPPAGWDGSFPIHIQQNYLAAAALICADDAPKTQDALYAALCRRRNRGLVQLLAAGEETAPVGCAVCTGPVAVGEDTAFYLSDVVVSPACRGRGLGSALVRGAGQLAAGAAPGGSLTAWCAGDKRRFYRRLGFDRICRVYRLTPCD